ncbi:MAG: YitT family protein [Clostridia bacterium]|nr:YitT family protein [Clostridia bacterium]
MSDLTKQGCLFNKKTVLEYLLVVLMGMLLATSYILFVVKNNFAPAGLNGVTVMIQYKLDFSVGFASLIINVPLCVFAFFKIDRKFGIRTLVFCLVYSLFYLFLQNVVTEGIQYNAQGVDTIYPVMISGLISGFIYGVLFRISASSGGTDIISKYVSKVKPSLNFFWVTFALNAVVAFSSLFVYSEGGIFDYKPVCLCLLYCFISSFMGNLMLKGNKQAYQFVIVTAHPEQIEDEIIHNLRHSATRLQGQGIYSKQEKSVLFCVVNKHQIVDFQNIIKKYPDTFTYVETVNETLGNFKKIK